MRIRVLSLGREKVVSNHCALSNCWHDLFGRTCPADLWKLDPCLASQCVQRDISASARFITRV